MKKRKETNYILIFAIITACVVIVTLAGKKWGNSVVNSVIFLVQQMVYMGMISIWGLEIRQRVLDASVRKHLTEATVFMLMWLLLRAAKYRLFDDSVLSLHYFWYMYYIPMLMIPLLFFVIAMEIRDVKNKDLLRKIGFTVAGVLIVLILTNDIHGFAFSFVTEGEFDRYNYGPVYFLAAFMIVFCITAGVLILAGNTRKYRPLLWLIVLAVYCILYAWKPVFFSDSYLIALPEAFCLIFLGVIESSIRVGFILTNTNYPEFMESISFPAVITDDNGNIIYSSAETIPPELLKEVKIDEDTFMKCKKVSGGKIYWVESIREINELSQKLTDAQEVLADENELLIAENNLKEDKEKTDAQNAIYEEIDRITEKQRGMIGQLLDGLSEDSEDYVEKTSKICILNAYIKRRCNLSLIAGTNGNIPVMELFYSIKESGEYIKLYGVSFDIQTHANDENAGAEIICGIYDYFESLIEGNIEGLLVFMVNIEMSGREIITRFTLEKSGELYVPAGSDIFSFSEWEEENTWIVMIKADISKKI